MSLINTITRPLNDFMVARLYGSRSVVSFTENAVARARGEEGGIGMQAAIISGGLVIIAIAIAAVLATRANEAEAGLTNLSASLSSVQAI